MESTSYLNTTAKPPPPHTHTRTCVLHGQKGHMSGYEHRPPPIPPPPSGGGATWGGAKEYHHPEGEGQKFYTIEVTNLLKK